MLEVVRSMKIRIFGHTNHIANQYEMLKLAQNYPVKFYYLRNNVRRWSRYHSSMRPEPSTWLSKDLFEWVDYYEPGKYDLAILHVDQQHVNPDIGKGQIYTELNDVIKDIPKIVVNHGTPMYPEMYDEDIVINGGTLQTNKGPKIVKGMKEKIGDNFMIVNSYESVERWGWGYPLIHGMDADEWYDLPKEPRAIISLSPGGLDKYYNRELLTHIKVRTAEIFGDIVKQISVDPVFWGNALSPFDWQEYREYIGRSLLYINMTKDSPMPRSRTEAMLSGCCILTSKYHGADDFIEQGKNGFIVPDNPMSYANTINELINYNYKDCVEIGQRGKETAKKYFGQERYQKELYYLINEVANGRHPKWDKTDKIW